LDSPNKKSATSLPRGFFKALPRNRKQQSCEHTGNWNLCLRRDC